MRADEKIFYEDIKEFVENADMRSCALRADYINQIRYERLMAKAEKFYLLYNVYKSKLNSYSYVNKTYRRKVIKSKLIAEAYEARAKKINE